MIVIQVAPSIWRIESTDTLHQVRQPHYFDDYAAEIKIGHLLIVQSRREIDGDPEFSLQFVVTNDEKNGVRTRDIIAVR